MQVEFSWRDIMAAAGQRPVLAPMEIILHLEAKPDSKVTFFEKKVFSKNCQENGPHAAFLKIYNAPL
jgi:hypothetical protein